MLKDLIGKVFTRLTVLGPDGSRGKNSYMKCQCSCGTIISVRRDVLLNGDQKSCGCLGREMTAARVAAAEPRRAEKKAKKELKIQKEIQKAERELQLKRMIRPHIKHVGRCWSNRYTDAVIRRLHDVSQLEIARFFNISVSEVNEIQQREQFDEINWCVTEPYKSGAPPFRALRCSCGRYQQVAAADSEIIAQQRHRIKELEAEVAVLKAASPHQPVAA